MTPAPVAHTKWDREGQGLATPEPSIFPPSNDENPRYYIDMLFRLFSSFGEKNPYEMLGEIKRFFAWFGEISNAPSRVEVLRYMVINKAATIPMMAEELDLPDTNARRAVKYLEKEGIVEKKIPINHRSKTGGRPPIMYAIIGRCSQDELIEAIQQDAKRRIPVYSEVKRIKQIILDEYITYRKIEEIRYDTILKRCKSYASNKYYSSDIARMVAQELAREKLLKVIM